QRLVGGFLPDEVAERLRRVFARQRLLGHARGSIEEAKRPARKSPGRTVSRRGCTLSLLPSGPDEVRYACCTGPGLIRAGRRCCGEDNGGAAGSHSLQVGNRRWPSLLRREGLMKRADIYLLGRGIVDGVGQMTLEALEA